MKTLKATYSATEETVSNMLIFDTGRVALSSKITHLQALLFHDKKDQQNTRKFRDSLAAVTYGLQLVQL